MYRLSQSRVNFFSRLIPKYVNNISDCNKLCLDVVFVVVVVDVAVVSVVACRCL